MDISVRITENKDFWLKVNPKIASKFSKEDILSHIENKYFNALEEVAVTTDGNTETIRYLSVET